MSDITLRKGTVTITFCVFSNGNAIICNGDKIYVINDVAQQYINLRENGYEEVKRGSDENR